MFRPEKEEFKSYQPGSSEEKGPSKEADIILNRIWNRKDSDPELSHPEALTLLLYGKDAGLELIKEEMEYGRYEPDPDVRHLLEKREGGQDTTIH